MQTEIEAKFLGIDHNAMRSKLDELGAVCVQPMRVMRRKVYESPDGHLLKNNAWLRIRDEGDKVTTSLKRQKDSSVTGTSEICVTIGDFDQMDALYKELGLVQTSYQETKRESWKLGDTEVELDEWPWAKPYIEIEAADEAELKRLAGDLGLDWDQAKHGSVEAVYMAEYDVTAQEVNAWPEITFTLVPQWLKDKRKTE